MSDDWIVVGEQAFTKSEWDAEVRRREAKRKRDAVYWREYRRKRGESLREYQREWQKRRRVYETSTEELDRKIEFHREFMERYIRERELRRKDAA